MTLIAIMRLGYAQSQYFRLYFKIPIARTDYDGLWITTVFCN